MNLSEVMNKNVKIIMKFFRYVFCIFFLILLALLMVFQYKAESYRIKSMEKYGVFKDSKRLRNTPVVWFYCKSRILRDTTYDIYFKSAHLPYRQIGKGEGYLFNNLYGAYFVYCYYDDLVLMNLLKTRMSLNEWPSR